MISALTTAQNLLKLAYQTQLILLKNPNHRVPVHGDYFMDTGLQRLPHCFPKKFYLPHTGCVREYHFIPINVNTFLNRQNEWFCKKSNFVPSAIIFGLHEMLR